MLKYLFKSIVFQEIPDETSLALEISGCIIRCKFCHSRELWEDKGTELTIEELDRLLKENEGVTCLLLMGGEHDIGHLVVLLQHVWGRIKTAWYCGLDMVPKDKVYICQFLDFLKLGHYDEELGGLSSPTTNQRLYKINHLANGDYTQEDITYKLIKKI